MLTDGQDSSEEGKGYEAGGQRYSDDTVRETACVMRFHTTSVMYLDV